jgi:hypothetical protein
MMPHRSYVSRLALVVFVFAALRAPAPARAQTPVAIPSSPAGALLKQGLEAFNNADSAALEAFSKAHFPRANAQAYMQLRRRSGGLELVRIISADPSRIVYAARTRVTPPTVLRGVIGLVDGDPSHINTMGLQGVPPGAPLEGCATYTSASTHGASAADVASEDAIVAALYDVISGPACQHRDWDRLRGLYAPGARLIPTTNATGTLGIRAETPDEYVAAVMSSMEEFGFFEKEISRVGESFNGIVHRFSTYESRRAASDPTPFARGINSIQLLNDGKRWWVVTVYWASERPGAPIPEIYLNRP